MVTDFFVACLHVTNFYTCCSFCGKNHGDGFLHHLFLVTGFFVAREHASDIHLGACGSQNHNGTDHGVKVAVKTDVSCQRSDTRNTIDNHNAKASPQSSLTTSLRRNSHPQVCHLCCTLKLLPDWGKRDDKSESRSVLKAESKIGMVADVLTNPPGTCMCPASSVWQTPKL